MSAFDPLRTFQGVVLVCYNSAPDRSSEESNMGDRRREKERRVVDKEAQAYRANVRSAKPEFAKNVARERAILDEAERTYGDQLSEDIQNMRAALDEAEREFLEESSRALREFNAGIRKSRRSARK
jgi:hypothetical protein